MRQLTENKNEEALLIEFFPRKIQRSSVSEHPFILSDLAKGEHTTAYHCPLSTTHWSLAGGGNRRRSGRARSGFGRGPGFEEFFLAINHGVDVVGSEFEAVAVSDGVGGTRLDAIAAENAAGIVDVVDLGVAVGVGDAIVGGVFRGFDVNAIRGARGGAKKTGDAFFEAVLVAMKHVNAAITRLKMHRFGGIIFRGGLLEHGDERHLEALVENHESAEEFFNDRCHKHSL